MAEQANEKKSKIHWRVVGMLFLILIILPAGSWYYLTQGYNYRKDLLNDLKEEFGLVKDYEAETTFGEVFGTEDIKANTAIVHFMGKNATEKDSIWSLMTRLHEQFDERNDIMFISHISDADSLQMSPDTAQWKILKGTSAYFDRLARDNYKLPLKPGETILNNPYLVLLDSTKIRQYYDYRDPMQAGRLVEHITIVMPRLAEKDIILERDQEK